MATPRLFNPRPDFDRENPLHALQDDIGFDHDEPLLDDYDFDTFDEGALP